MKFTRLETQNTYSFRSLKTDLTPGLHLVLGENRDGFKANSNQSGKSNIFESLCWTLYGKGTKEVPPDGSGTYTGFNKASVIHNGTKSCKGRVWLEDDGQEYSIERIRKTSPVIIVRRGDEIVGETQDDVDRVLGMSYDTFIQSVFFSQGTKRFTQAKDSEIKSVLDDILGMRKWGEALKKCRLKLKELKSEKNRIEQDNRVLTAEIESLESSLLLADKYHQEKRRAYEEFEDRKSKKLDSIQERISTILLRLQRLGYDESPPKSTSEALESKERFLKKANSLRDEMNFCHRKLGELKSDGTCPSCDQEITPEYVESFRGKYQTRFKDAEAEFSEANRQADIYDSLGILLSHLDEYEQVALETVEEPSPRDVSNIQAKIEDKKSKLIEDDTLDRSISDLSVLEDAFGNAGVKSLILDNILPILNDTANRYASALLGGKTELIFDTEARLATGGVRDRFSITVKTEGGEGYGLCSGGERRRLDFAVALALQSLLPDSGLFVCDEPFESVDETGQRAIVNLLREYADERNAAVYVITHEPVMQSLFDSEITVIKENGTSRIES